MSFVRTWTNLETIILSKLTQEQKYQTLHVLTHRQVLYNENTWTQGGEHHTLGGWGLGKGQQGVGRLGRDNIGMSDMSDREMEAAKHHGFATILQDLHMYPRTQSRIIKSLKKTE